jgi:hypothetical protein
MPVEQIWDSVLTYLKDHWVQLLVAVGSAGLGWVFGKRRARSQWRKREFYDRLNVSLSSIRDGKLLIRTLIEKRCDEVFLNRVATETVLAAAHRTTADDSLLSLPEDDYWFYLNAVLNEVAEHFAEGQLRRDAGGEVVCATYLLCLTCENAGGIRTRKVRAMMVQKTLLENLPSETPRFESPTHSTRWDTLRQLAAARKTYPGRFLEVEICV